MTAATMVMVMVAGMVVAWIAWGVMAQRHAKRHQQDWMV